MKQNAFEIAAIASVVAGGGGKVTFKSQTIYGEGRYPVQILLGHDDTSWFTGFEVDMSDARTTRQKPYVLIDKKGLSYHQVLNRYRYLFQRELSWGKTTLFDPDKDPETIREKRRANGWKITK